MKRRTAALAVLLLLSACKKTPKPDIPVYPDAQGIKGAGTMQDATVILYNNRWTTLTNMSMVITFYEQALLSRPGWTVKGDRRERLIFTDGNMRLAAGLYTPIDPTKGGGYVEIINASDMRVMIDIWQSFPAPKK
jgi:hypothetical protein